MVAGAVRDALLGVRIQDYDFEIFGIEVSRLTPILKTLAPQSIDTVGASFGVLKARFGDLKIGDRIRVGAVHTDPTVDSFTVVEALKKQAATTAGDKGKSGKCPY